MKRKGLKRLVNGLLASVMAVSLAAVSLPSEAWGKTQETTEEARKIENDIFWEDMDGNALYSQGGGIFKFGDTYYWYGVKYKNAPNYVNDPTKYYTSGDTYSDFESITCYSSTDLVNWKFEGDVVTEADVSYRDEMEGVKASWVGRLGVAKVKDTYVMMVQHECADPDDSLDTLEGYEEPSGQKGWSKQVLVLTSDSPTGKFTWNQRINMLPYTGGTTNTGDQTVFTDEETGKSYLVYSYGVGRSRIFLCEIEDQGDGKFGLALNKNYMIYSGAGREGDCMFKYNGSYYVCASDLYGWNASHAYWLKLDSLEDDYLEKISENPYSSMNLMDGCSDDYCHVTQTGFFYTVQGTKQDTVIFCGDRWAEFAGNGLGFNQWCPLSFNNEGIPYFNSLSSWYLNEKTGEWSVAKDNNFVKNGSFDADRVSVTELTGWTNSITSGNSPVKNSSDCTTGKYGLVLTDTIDFECSVSQVIESSPYVQLPDGVYSLSARIKNSDGFDTLSLYAKVNGVKVGTSVSEENENWTTVTLDGVNIAGGKAEIGIEAEGKANAFCYIDDITLVRTGDVSSETGSISGTIRSDIAGQTLTVEAVQKNGTVVYTYETVLTEGEQSFILDSVEAGDYVLSASAYGCEVRAEGSSVTVASGQSVSGVSIRVTGNMGNIKGSVVDDGRASVADAAVTLSRGNWTQTVVTDEEGLYEFTDVEAGEYELSFEKTGYSADKLTKVTVEKNQTVTMDPQILVRNIGSIEGIVYDASGNPAANAVVMLRGSSSNSDMTRVSTKTDENGKYSFDEMNAGTYTLTASDGEWDTSVNAVAQNVAVTSGNITDVKLNIPTEIAIVNGGFESGMDSNRQPAEGWTTTGTSGRASNESNRGHVYSGTYGYTVWTGSAFTVGVSQTITGLENGTYTVQVMASAGAFGESDELYLYAKNADGQIIARENIPVTVDFNESGRTWELIGLTAEVTDTTLTIGVSGDMPANAWANFDDFRIGKIGGSDAAGADKTGLKVLIEEINSFDTSSYTAASVTGYKQLFEEALNNAETVINNESATQDEVDQAVDALSKAFTAAKEKLVTLEAKLAQGIAVSIENVKTKDVYTEESWSVYDEALKDAQGLQGSEGLTEEKVDAAVKALQEAVSGLIEKPAEGDKTDLESLIEEVKHFDISAYTEASVSEYMQLMEEVLENAETVKNDESATQDEVDQAVDALSKAFTAAKEKLVTLEAKLAQGIAVSIENVKTKDVYTEESWSVYDEALKAAQGLQGSEGLTEEKVDAAVKALQETVSGLKEAAVDPDDGDKNEPVNPDNGDTPDKGDSPNNGDDQKTDSNIQNPSAADRDKGTAAAAGKDKGNTAKTVKSTSGVKTGDTNTAVWFVMFAAAAIVCIAGLRRRKQ